MNPHNIMNTKKSVPKISRQFPNEFFVGDERHLASSESRCSQSNHIEGQTSQFFSPRLKKQSQLLSAAASTESPSCSQEFNSPSKQLNSLCDPRGMEFTFFTPRSVIPQLPEISIQQSQQQQFPQQHQHQQQQSIPKNHRINSQEGKTQQKQTELSLKKNMHQLHQNIQLNQNNNQDDPHDDFKMLWELKIEQSTVQTEPSLSSHRSNKERVFFPSSIPKKIEDLQNKVFASKSVLHTELLRSSLQRGCILTSPATLDSRRTYKEKVLVTEGDVQNNGDSHSLQTPHEYNINNLNINEQKRVIPINQQSNKYSIRGLRSSLPSVTKKSNNLDILPATAIPATGISRNKQNPSINLNLAPRPNKQQSETPLQKEKLSDLLKLRAWIISSAQQKDLKDQRCNMMNLNKINHVGHGDDSRNSSKRFMSTQESDSKLMSSASRLFTMEEESTKSLMSPSSSSASLRLNNLSDRLFSKQIATSREKSSRNDSYEPAGAPLPYLQFNPPQFYSLKH